MKVTISEQILVGNLHEGFLLNAYLEAIDSEYRRTVEHFYPGAEVEIDFDIQNASGYSHPRVVEVYADDGEWADDGSNHNLTNWLECDAIKIADDNRWYA